MKSRKAIFLDRDGTINRNTEYLIDFANFELLPGVESALQIFQKLDFRLFVVTNQSGVARGYFSYQAVIDLNQKIQEFLQTRGIPIVELVVCPHHPDGKILKFKSDCLCRKPKPGMLRYLETKYNILMPESYMVGDAGRDVLAGIHAGTHAVLIKPNGDSSGKWDRVDSQANIKEFESLLDFATNLKDFG